MSDDKLKITWNPPEGFDREWFEQFWMNHVLPVVRVPSNIIGEPKPPHVETGRLRQSWIAEPKADFKLPEGVTEHDIKKAMAELMVNRLDSLIVPSELENVSTFSSAEPTTLDINVLREMIERLRTLYDASKHKQRGVIHLGEKFYLVSRILRAGDEFEVYYRDPHQDPETGEVRSERVVRVSLDGNEPKLYLITLPELKLLDLDLLPKPEPQERICPPYVPPV